MDTSRWGIQTGSATGRRISPDTSTTTGSFVVEMGTPDEECPGCEPALSENGPPTCPRCGAPYRR